MIVFPNAKINVGLNVLRRRDDGYHDIETVMVPVQWCDVLEIVPSQGIESSLTVYNAQFDCPAEKNLVMKALRAVEQVAGQLKVDIFLHKNIPDGAGLGGGSSDAAFTVKALNQMFSLGMSNDAMAALVAPLGADCPFFIYNSPMLATGIGNDLQPIQLTLPGEWVVVVKPGDSVSTAEAYCNVTPCETGARLTSLITDRRYDLIKNDFEDSVFTAHPSIVIIKQSLIEWGACYAAMSGSGSAVYGIFKDEATARSVAGEYPGLSCHVSKLTF